MVETLRVSATTKPETGSRRTGIATVVGASYAFDPGADGIAGIYAARVLERGIDPRALCAEVRADHLGGPDRGIQRRALMTRARTAHFGRGTALHLQVAHGSGEFRHTNPWVRRLAVAGIAVLLLLPFGIIVANAEETPAQSRYIVEPGDTLEGIAAEFGVDASAILAASTLQNPPQLTPSEIVVIPDPSETPDAAAWNASQRQGASPFVAGAHDVAAGETLASISGNYGLDPWALAAFNGISDVDSLVAGQLLRIPLAEEAWVADAVGGMVGDWEEPAGGTVFAADAPAYLQSYSLSCEYAAAYIATAAFGWGIPESAFLERIGTSANPHWGYRGSIHGAWGGTDDYGIYPEALVPTLNEFGFIGDVFYGSEASALTSRIDAGMPVMTWLGYFGDTAWLQEDEGSYLLVPGMHVVTVYGYDDGGVYVSNPGRGSYDYYPWGDFLSMWSVLDGMALGVAPV